MTPRAREQLEAWQAELAAELADLQTAASQAQRDLEAAQAAHTEAAAGVNELATLLDAAQVGGTPGCLLSRLEGARNEALRPHVDARGTAHARLKGLRSLIDGRRAALKQISRALAPQEPAHRPEVIRRKPPQLEYDPIITGAT
jgi:hypothetical protein